MAPRTTRKKVKLQWIESDVARKATFEKRKTGLLKKVSELSTLCGVEAMAIVMSPYDPQPEVWPSPQEVHHTLHKFNNLPELDQKKKMLNQEDYLRSTKIEKIEDQLWHAAPNEATELKAEQRLKQILSGASVDVDVDDLTLGELDEMAKKIDKKVN